ncbi:MAG: hypothetical protein QN178_10120 [Armatimonadota bacterium]|nr:hypothetical protein [Armatimonadota bacterium]
MNSKPRIAVVALTLLFACGASLIPALAQAPAQIIRAVMTKEEGRILLIEVDSFLVTDPKAVAWVQVTPSLNRRTIAFRWVTPSGEVFRLSPAIQLLPGDEVVWDVIPIRDGPAERLVGLWRVDVFVDEQFATRVYFRILSPPPRLPVTVRFETVLSHDAVHTWRPGGGHDVFNRYIVDQRVEVNAQVARADLTLRAAGGLTGTDRGGDSRVSFVVGMDHPAGIAFFAGREAQTVADRLDPARPSVLTTSTFLDFRFTSTRLPSVGIVLSRVDRTDSLTPAFTDDTESSASFNVSYSRFPWTAVLVHTQTDTVDRTGAEPSGRNRSTGGSLVYVASPSLVLIGTHISTVRDEDAFGGLGPFTFTGSSTVFRASLTVNPALTLGLTYGFGGSARNDGLFDVQTRLIGGEATYLLSPALTLRAGYQADTIDIVTAGIPSRLSSTTFLGTLEYRPRPTLFMSVSYLPSRAEVVFGTPQVTSSLTGVISYFPSPRFGLNLVYTGVDTTGADPLTLRALALSLRYDLRPELVLNLVAQGSRQRFPLDPARDFDALFYGITLNWKY